MTPLLLNVKQAAQALGISEWSVRHLIADGVLPTVKLPSSKRPGEDSRRILVALSDLEELIRRHREVAS